MLPLNAVYNDDCFNILSQIPDKSIQLILTDPPYEFFSTTTSWDKKLNFDILWSEFNRIIKDDGAVLIFGAGQFAGKVICSNPKQYRYQYIWVKSNVTNFAQAKKQPMRKHEQVLVFYKKQPVYNPQGLIDITKQRKNGSVSSAQIYSSPGLKTDYIQTHTGYPNDLLHYALTKEEKGLHATQKPVALCEHLIKTYTNSGDVVLDPFAGSGTSLVAAKNTGRDFIGIEKDAEYAQVIKNRLV